MGFFDRMREPLFLKESSDLERQIEVLKAIEPTLNMEGKEIIRQDLKFLEYGLIGEKNIAFELRNSHIPMYILHDVYLNSDGLSAQIDYLVFTRTLCFVIECKNLYGDIEINHAGDFVRSMSFGNRVKREGIYSPITQNQRHLEMMKKMMRDKRTNPLMKIMHDKWFEDSYRTVVVLANPKTVLNAKYAKKEVKNQVIRADQLVTYIKDECKKCKEASQSDEGLFKWADSYLKLHMENIQDYTAKYDAYRTPEITKPSAQRARKIQEVSIEVPIQTLAKPQRPVMPVKPAIPVMPTTASMSSASAIEDTKATTAPNAVPHNHTAIEDLPLFKDLKAYRLAQSKKEAIKPYFIFNDSQLKDLIGKMPKSTLELQAVSGFGPVKAEKYGEEILKIIERHR